MLLWSILRHTLPGQPDGLPDGGDGGLVPAGGRVVAHGGAVEAQLG